MSDKMGDNEDTYASFRSRSSQKNRNLVHPSLDPSLHHPNTLSSSSLSTSGEHTFVVCADTQFGMTNMNTDWNVEIEYSRQAIQVINSLQPRPLFCCVCGDLVDMTALIYAKPKQPETEDAQSTNGLSEDECNRIQDSQFEDFKRIWEHVHPDIALVCLCGNHDVGNRPTKASIARFTSNFGDDYFAWWANGTYNIALNTSLFSDPIDDGARDLYEKQFEWLKQQLEYAAEQKAGNIFVFGHHPWFLYREDETSDELLGESPFPPPWGYRADLGRGSERDGYFHIAQNYRKPALELFQRYGVSACFSGHFHQNLVAKTSFGMDMIVTGPLSLVFESTGVPKDFPEPKTRGIRVVRVQRDLNGGKGHFEHTFLST